MTTDRGALAALLATMTMLASASPAMAQAEQTAPVRGLEGLANPAPQTSTSIPIPDAPKIVLPSETPAPRRATRPRAPEKAVADKPAAERSAVRSEPDSRQTRAATGPTRSSAPPEPTPLATPTAEPASPSLRSETPSTESAPQVVAPQSVEPQSVEPQPTPDTTTQSTVTAPETGRAMPLWLSLAVVIVVLGALWALRRKPHGRRQDRAEVETAAEPTPEPSAPELAAAPEPAVISSAAAATTRSVQPVAAPVLPATPAAPKFLEPRAKTPPPAPAAPRARVTCDLRPLRAGLNLLSATVECELVVTNTGTAPAEAIRTGVALLTAHAGQDTDLAQFNAAPIGRPATPPFALAPGETRTIRTVVAIARDAIRTMTAANRPMFVPVVATNILYTTAGDDAQTSRAWVVGIERVDSAKLAPFWLDAPAKMFTTVAARPHAATFER